MDAMKMIFIIPIQNIRVYRDEKKEAYKKCIDKFYQEIFEGDYLDVQNEKVARLVYKKEDGQLYFTPYGKEDRVFAYFSNDIVRCDKNLNWL